MGREVISFDHPPGHVIVELPLAARSKKEGVAASRRVSAGSKDQGGNVTVSSAAEGFHENFELIVLPNIHPWSEDVKQAIFIEGNVPARNQMILFAIIGDKFSSDCQPGKDVCEEGQVAAVFVFGEGFIDPQIIKSNRGLKNVRTGRRCF